MSTRSVFQYYSITIRNKILFLDYFLTKYNIHFKTIRYAQWNKQNIIAWLLTAILTSLQSIIYLYGNFFKKTTAGKAQKNKSSESQVNIKKNETSKVTDLKIEQHSNYLKDWKLNL